MARRKARTKTRRVYVKSKPKRRRTRSSGNVKGLLLASAGYGAVREKISSALAPVSSKFLGMAGNIADEVTILGGAYLLHKKVRNATMKNFLKGAMIVESARIGESLVDGSFKTGSSTSTGFKV